jgi:hypothetical protein
MLGWGRGGGRDSPVVYDTPVFNILADRFAMIHANTENDQAAATNTRRNQRPLPA